MHQVKTVWAMLFAAVALAACGGAQQPTSEDTGKSSTLSAESATAAPAPARINSVDAVIQDVAAQKAGASEKDPVVQVPVDRRAAQQATTTVDLGSPDPAQLEQRIRNNRRSDQQLMPKAYQTGFARPVSMLSNTKSFQQQMRWSPTPSGMQQARVRLSSAGAEGIRLGLLVQSLPDDVVLRVYAEGDDRAQETTGAHVNAMIRANVAADGDSPAARTYWMPTTLGEVAVLELDLPAGRDPATVGVSVPSLVHQVESAMKANLAQIQTKTACPGVTPDASCTTPLPPAANATASMDFVDGVNSYVCTGTLVANRGTVQQGYFLTANHCIGNQTVASTLTNYWFWRSSACNTGTVGSYVAVGGGGTLLFTRPDASASQRSPTGTDTTLLDLVNAPPAGAVYAGWAFERHAANNGINYTAWHNPGGDLLRRSDGRLVSQAIYLANDTFFVGNNPSYPIYEVSWTTGITEEGSSGSGLFADGATSNPKIMGQLWAGFSSCSNPAGRDYYGRFDLAYENGLINWLNPGYRMVFRFYRPSNGTHFFSADVGERDAVRATNTAYTYEAPVFMVAPAPGAGLSPVYRFYNKRTGVHFYTIDEAERATTQANTAVFNFEGIGWYARKADAPASGTVEVYRFFRNSAGTHLYTTSVAERDNIINNLGRFYTYEGVAYLAWPVN